MKAQLQLNLLGRLEICRDGTLVTGFRSAKCQALLGYLAVTGRPHSRPALAGLLWGDMPEPRARMNLSKTLSNLKQLAGDHLTITRPTIAFNRTASYSLDVETFTATLENPKAPIEQVQAAVELYHGDFLDGFYLRDALEFEEWTLTQRARLRELALQTLHRLSLYHTQRGQVGRKAALDYTSRLLTLEPWREEAHRQMMLLLCLTGQRSAALAQYETCCRLLADELGVEPEPATIALYEQIRGGQLSQEPEPHQVGAELTAAPALPGIPAPLRNLPPQPTLFIGREAELAEISALLIEPACRLLTLVGPGGIGKTRLAIEAARHSSRTHGVGFVPLAPLSSAELLVSAIAEAVGLTFYGSSDPKQQLFNYLRDQELLLVFDNFEHLLLPPQKDEGAANPPDSGDGTSLIAELLEHAPKLKFLVTSRERLNLQSEWIFSVEGLTVPLNGNAEEIEAFSAPRLFLQRARRLNRKFGQQSGERLYIGQICRLVGGIPLALELAAAWTKVLSCSEIVREIERNLDFLAVSVRDLPPRHRNMRAVFDYSWQMLTAQERQLFQCLSVCRGGFTRAAAEAIAGDIPWTGDDLQLDAAGEVQLTQRQPDILKALSGLVDKSFLQHTPAGRYEVHELMRQYGAARLAAKPENEARTRDRHAVYYLNLVAHQEALMKGRGQRRAHQRVAQEFENIKLAWLHAAEQGRADALIRAFNAFWLSCVERNVFYELVNVCAQARLRLEKCLPLAGRPQSSIELALGAMLLGEGFMSFRIGDFSIAGKTDQAIAMFRSLKADRLTALALDGKGVIDQSMGDYEAARQCFAESAELSRKAGDRWLTGYSLNDLGLVTHLLGDTAAAQELSRQSLDILTELDDRRGKAFAFNNLGLYAFHQGDYAEADWLYRECIKLRQVNNDQWGVATGIIHLGAVARARGETHQANQHLLEAIRTALKVRAWPVVLDALVELALLLAAEGGIDRAEEILQLCLHHPGLAKAAQVKAEQQLATLRGVAKPLPLAKLPEDDAVRELEALLARLLSE